MIGDVSRCPYEVMWRSLKWYVAGRTHEIDTPEAVHAISAQMGMLELVHLTDTAEVKT